MKRTILAFILTFASHFLLSAQCVVSVTDTARIYCGESRQIHASVGPVVIPSSTSNTLNQVCFRDPAHGYIAGENGTFLRTTDGGYHWVLTTFLAGQNWKSVAFPSEQTGYMVSADGKIAKTTDGGTTWNVIFEDPARHFTRVRFINPTTGFAIGEPGVILKTTDGNTWNPVSSGTSARLNDVVFVNPVKGFIAGDFDNQNVTNTFLATTDGGNTWTNTMVVAGQNNFNTVVFANENTGYVGGSFDTYRTTNGGGSWESVFWQAEAGIALQDDSTGFHGTYSSIYRFSHGGSVHEWFYSSPQTLVNVTCPDNRSMVAVGSDGLILSFHTPVSYQWLPAEGLDSANVPAPVASPYQTTVYHLSVLLSDGTYCIDSTRVEVRKDWSRPDLCMVTVDSATSHNRVVWNKPGNSAADSVFVYKEGTVSGQFVKLAGYSAAAAGEYVDEQSNSAVQAETYAIKILDKCLFVSELGYTHRPVHLSVNHGVGGTCNLIWEPYQGTDVYTYNIYRRVAAGTPELMASVSGSITQYTDLTPPAGDLNYVVEAMLNAECSLKTEGASSFSNLAPFSLYPHGIGDDAVPEGFRILDNPVSDHFAVNAGKVPEIASIHLLSMNGESLAGWNNPSASSFDVSRLAPGLYMLKMELRNNHRSFMQKLVKL
ncbi:MAG TPA: YCF48-related protein [Bacteroidales bacterium]|nr:YCF48-related protein [Bacteroidales bacterium]